jgi:DNA-binding transcriptional ArsR family regulator
VALLPPPSTVGAPRFDVSRYRLRLRDAGTFGALSLSEQVVLAAFCDLADDAGLSSPAVGDLVEAYNLGESTIREAIRQLEARGLVIVERPGGRTNRYQLAMTDATHQAGAEDGRHA